MRGRLSSFLLCACLGLSCASDLRKNLLPLPVKDSLSCVFSRVLPTARCHVVGQLVELRIFFFEKMEAASNSIKAVFKSLWKNICHCEWYFRDSKDRSPKTPQTSCSSQCPQKVFAVIMLGRTLFAYLISP